MLTGAGRLPFKGIIHVAGINLLWRASERSVSDSCCNSLAIAEKEGIASIAFPLIGAGTGSLAKEVVVSAMQAAFQTSDYKGRMLLVNYVPNNISSRALDSEE